MKSLRQLIHEVHRRSVWQVVTVYLAASWVALQVVQTVVESAQLPEWLPGMALVLLVIGFPIVVATAFVQEGAPRLHRSGEPPQLLGADEDDSDPSGDLPAAGFWTFLTWRNAIRGGVAAFALWGVVATFLVTTGRPVGPAALGASDRPSIAVLPLEALSMVGAEGDDVFARGFHDEIITRLSQIGALRVTSRTSVMGYAGQTTNLRQIARELSVDLVLEGSLQRTDQEIALNVQLLDGATDENIWAQSFRRAYSVDDAFSLQRELAEQIVRELELTLSPEEADQLAESAPTENDEAYQLYLQANDFSQAGPRTEDFATAIRLYERAGEIDPDFAIAHARAAYNIGQALQVNSLDRDVDWEARAWDAVERARSVDPDLPEAYLAEAQLRYALEQDYGRALAALNRASGTGLKSDYLHLLGAAQRRLGDFDATIESWSEMARLDPTSAHYEEDLGSVYFTAGRFEEAIPHLARSIELDPAPTFPHQDLIRALVAVDGGTERAWAAVDAAEAGTGDDWSDMRMWLHMLDRDEDQALAHAASPFDRATVLHNFGRGDEVASFPVPLLDIWRAEGSEEIQDAPRYLEWGAVAAALSGDAELTRQRSDALLRRVRVSDDAIVGVRFLHSMAEAHMIIGDQDRALELLEELRRHPSEFSDASLRLLPLWDPVRDDPRFQAVVGETR